MKRCRKAGASEVMQETSFWAAREGAMHRRRGLNAAPQLVDAALAVAPALQSEAPPDLRRKFTAQVRRRSRGATTLTKKAKTPRGPFGCRGALSVRYRLQAVTDIGSQKLYNPMAETDSTTY